MFPKLCRCFQWRNSTILIDQWNLLDRFAAELTGHLLLPIIGKLPDNKFKIENKLARPPVGFTGYLFTGMFGSNKATSRIFKGDNHVIHVW